MSESSSTTDKPGILLFGFIFAIASAALFSIRPIFVKLVYAEGVDSTTLLVLRMLFSAPVYGLLLVYFLRRKANRDRLNNNNVILTCFSGLLGYYGASLLDLMGLEYVTAQLGRMILYSYPTFVVLFGALFFAQALKRRTLIALAITYFGVAIIFGHDLEYFGSDVITGGLLITVSAILFAFYLLLSKSLIESMGSQVFTCIALLAASLGIVTHFLVTHSIATTKMTPTALHYIIVIAILCTVIPTFFTTAAVARIGADRTSIISMIGPVFTSLFAVTMLGEAFTWFHFFGIVFVIAGVFVLHKR